MSAYCFRAKMVQFSKGQSAVHTAAYNARTELEHRAENRQTRDYDKHGGLIFTGIFAPKDAPEWVKDRGELWNRAEEAERQKANGQPARNIMLALPQELSEEARLRLVKDFVREAFVRKGMIADVNIHAPDIERGDDPRNFHAHILLTTRTLDGENFAKTKTDARHWNKGSTMEAWREKWAHMGAKALEKEGHTLEAARYREGHRTHEAQAEAALARGDTEWFEHHKDRAASLHNGPAVTEMERKGKHTDRGDENRAIVQLNENVRELRAVQEEMARVEALEALRKADQADEKALRKPIAKELHEAAKQEAVNASVERKEGREAASQREWQQKDKTAPKGQERPDKGGLKVGKGIGGAAVGLVSFVTDYLSAAATSTPEKDAQAHGIDPRRERQAAKNAAILAEDRDRKALRNIANDIERGRNLSPADVSHLTRDHQEQIKAHGDDALRQMVDDSRRYAAREWRGEGRERD